MIGKSRYQYLIAFLGNTGSQYDNTRHNAGFMVGDYIAQKLSVSFSKNKFNSLCADATINNQKILMIKPQTFMNNSGRAVLEASKYYKIPSSNIIIVYDEIALDPGQIRIKISGSDAGHNGVSDVLSVIDDVFIRIRIGVGSKPVKEMDLAAWVLGKITDIEKSKIESRFCDIFEIIQLVSKGDIQKAMNLYNKKK